MKRNCNNCQHYWTNFCVFVPEHKILVEHPRVTTCDHWKGTASIIEKNMMALMEEQIHHLPPPPEGCYYTIDNPDFRFDYERGAWDVNFNVVLKKAKEEKK